MVAARLRSASRRARGRARFEAACPQNHRAVRGERDRHRARSTRAAALRSQLGSRGWFASANRRVRDRLASHRRGPRAPPSIEACGPAATHGRGRCSGARSRETLLGLEVVGCHRPARSRRPWPRAPPPSRSLLRGVLYCSRGRARETVMRNCGGAEIEVEWARGEQRPSPWLDHSDGVLAGRAMRGPGARKKRRFSTTQLSQRAPGQKGVDPLAGFGEYLDVFPWCLGFRSSQLASRRVRADAWHRRVSFVFARRWSDAQGLPASSTRRAAATLPSSVSS